MNILVVDDERIQLETLKRGLRMKGHTVFEALDAKAAFDHLHDPNKKIDLVLADYILHGIDGHEFLRRLREENKTIPFIMITAYSDKEIALKILKDGCNGYLEKPFTLNELIDEINRVKNQHIPPLPTGPNTLTNIA